MTDGQNDDIRHTNNVTSEFLISMDCEALVKNTAESWFPFVGSFLAFHVPCFPITYYHWRLSLHTRKHHDENRSFSFVNNAILVLRQKCGGFIFFLMQDWCRK